MANQEIHNYVNEQITPNTTDYLDLDADVGGGNFLSKKLTFFNLRKWLFRLVSQGMVSFPISASGRVGINLAQSNAFELDISNQDLTLFPVNNGVPLYEEVYSDHATFIWHINNITGQNIYLGDEFITEPNNPQITTTIGGYAQVWITYRKKTDNTVIYTANTINFS